jgi:hypothetical protein
MPHRQADIADTVVKKGRQQMPALFLVFFAKCYLTARRAGKAS